MARKWLLLLPLAAALAGWAAWSSFHASPDMPAGFAGANGRLSLERMDIATLYPGRVAQVLVQEGEQVAADTVLAVLASSQTDSQVAAARATERRAREAVARAEAEIAARRQQRRLARLELDNARQLRRQALIAEAELKRRQAAHAGAAAAVKAAIAARAEATAAVEQAAAQLEAATAASDDMQIRAPQPGRVEYRLAEPGSVLGAGQRVITLLDPGNVSMSIFLPTETVGRIRVGDEARIVLDAMDAVWPATVSFVAADAQFTPKFVETADERARLMYRVKLKIPPATAWRHDGLLKGGLVGNGYVRTDPHAGWPDKWQVRLPE